MKRKILSLFLAGVLCAGLLPVTVSAAAPGEHTGHIDWTPLTPDYLTTHDYTLGDGRYFIDGPPAVDPMDPEYIQSRTEEFDHRITIEGDVTLCLYNTEYLYTGSAEPALVVKEDATLTYCNCAPGEYGNYLGRLSAISGNCLIENHGTLHIASGEISISTEASIAVNNWGTLSVTGGNINGGPFETVDWNGTERAPGFGIYNQDGGVVSIGGEPMISGTRITAPDGNIGKSANGISTANAISAVAGGAPYSGDWSVYIHYRGEPGVVVTDVWGSVEDYSGNWNSFSISYPENAELLYNEADGTLTYPGYSSLNYCGAIVYSGNYYKVQPQTEDLTEWGFPYVYQTSVLTNGTEEDYDIYWDEDSKTLTLNTLSCVVDADAISDTLFSANCDTLGIRLIGENRVTLGSSKNMNGKKTSVFENTGGGIVVQTSPEGSLTVGMPLGDGAASPDGKPGVVDTMAAFRAAGSFENRADLTITSAKNSETRECRNIIGIASGGFSNNGTLTVNLEGADNTYIIQCNGDFKNTGIMDLDAASVYEGNGINIINGHMDNTKTITLDIISGRSAAGITSGSFAGNWSNSGTIAIHISGSPKWGVGALSSYRYIAGVDIWSDGALAFTNSGTLDVTAHKKPDDTNINDTNIDTSDASWPIDLYFDTIGILLVPRVSPALILNSGTMTARAENGYSAALDVYVPKENVTIINEGTMALTATTTGGENIRAAGIFSMMQGGDDGSANKLALDLRDGSSLTATAGPAGGIAEPAAVAVNCQAVCLAQNYFPYQTPPSSADGFQQITLGANQYIAEGGEVQVLGPIETGTLTAYTAYLNTIGKDGVPAQTVQAKPKTPLTGSVAVDGRLRSGSTLTAKTENVPDDARLSFQWQVCDTPDGAFADIPGATKQTYDLTNDEIGKYVRVVATPSDPQYSGTLTATAAETVARKSSGGSGTTYYTVQYDIGGGSALSNQRVAKNSKAPKPDDPQKEGFAFSGWYADPDLKTEYDFNKGVTGNLTLYAKWTQSTTPTPTPTPTPSPTPTPVPVWENPFNDVQENDWFHGDVEYVCSNGIFKGLTEDRFGPDSPMSRAMMVTVLWRLAGSPAAPEESRFADVADGLWYTDAVTWAHENEIVLGIGNGLFAPDTDITREQLAAILRRYQEFSGQVPPELTPVIEFTDAGSISGYAQEAVRSLTAQGLVSGKLNHLFDPQGTATRAEVAAILHRFLEAVPEPSA